MRWKIGMVFCLVFNGWLEYFFFQRQTNLEKEEIVAELVHGFLIPETQKEVVRQQSEDFFFLLSSE